MNDEILDSVDIKYMRNKQFAIVLCPEWSLVAGILHHNTCPKIDGEVVKGSWVFMFMDKCPQCDAVVPDAVKLKAMMEDNSDAR